jgi:hypothetical protein
MRVCFIVLWAFAFDIFGAALSGVASALLERANISIQFRISGVNYIAWAFLLTGAFLGIYEKLPGTKIKKSGL